MKPHIPVLLKQTIEGLHIISGKRYIDATTGAGGHANEIERMGGVVLRIDADPDTDAIHENFRNIKEIAKEQGFSQVNGVLFDLGLSSHQLDSPERGFSYRFEDATLDMRFSKQGITAKEYLQKVSENELYEILTKFGEIERARSIARDIVSARPVTTGDLLKIAGTHNKDKVFQAIRIAMNDELESLKLGLIGAQSLLVPGGRLAVISFHSLEDRIVKQFMRNNNFTLITKKPITPDQQEITHNRRSRSAKLRIAQKI